MSKAYEEFKTYLDRAMALKTAMTLFEWDNETLAPKEAGELTSNVIGTLSGEYFQAVTNDRMKALVKELQAERGAGRGSGGQRSGGGGRAGTAGLHSEK